MIGGYPGYSNTCEFTGRNLLMAKKNKQIQAKDLHRVCELLNAVNLRAFQTSLDNIMDEADKHDFDREWIEEAWKVRDELKQDLEPLVEGKSAARIEQHL